MIIAIDFDGTCVTHDFPKIGKDIGAVSVLKELVANGHSLILYTVRSDDDRDIEKMKLAYKDNPEILPVNGTYLKDAVNWFVQNEIPLMGANINHQQKLWSTSPKVYAHLYIDDGALGAPLLYPHTHQQKPSHSRPYIDWETVRYMLILKGFIQEKRNG